VEAQEARFSAAVASAVASEEEVLGVADSREAEAASEAAAHPAGGDELMQKPACEQETQWNS
jgi:hypothetical protein